MQTSKDYDGLLEKVTVNNITLHFAVAGEGRPIVLIHGNGEDHHLFDTEMRQLVDAGYKVYAPDSRGHGANAPLSEYHYTDMAEDMFCFIETLGLDKPAIYWHSDGGIIGLILEISHPGTLGASFLEEFTAKNQEEPDPLVTLMLTEPHIDPDRLKNITIPVLVTDCENDLIVRS